MKRLLSLSAPILILFCAAAGPARAAQRDDAMQDAAAKWAPIAQKLAGDPWFKLLALDKIHNTKGNLFAHHAVLNLDGVAFEFHGTLTLDPYDADGDDVIATLVSATTAPARGTLNFGRYAVDAARLEASVTSGTDPPSIQVRVVPGLPGLRGDYYLAVTPKGSSVSGLLTGSSLRLRDFIPAAADADFLSDFQIRSIQPTAGAAGVSVAGILGGHSVTVSAASQGALRVAGAGLALNALIPNAAQLPALGGVVVSAVDWDGKTLAVSGARAGKPLKVTRAADGRGFRVEGPALGLNEVFPRAAAIPFLKTVTVDAVDWATDGIRVEGSAGARAAVVESKTGTVPLDVSGDALTLADFIPAAAAVPALKGFAFGKLETTDDGVAVFGSVAGKKMKVALAHGANSFTVSGADLALTDFVPGAAGVPFLAAFKVDSVDHRGTDVVVSGKVGERAAVVALRGDGSFHVSGAALKLADFAAQADQVPFLDAFAFLGLERAKGATAVNGTVGGKSVRVDLRSGGGFALSGAGLSLGDFVPGASAVPALGAFTLTRVDHAGVTTTVSGTLGGKAVSVELKAHTPGFDLTGAGLALKDFVPAAAGVPFLNTFAFKDLRSDPHGVTVSGTAGGKAVAVYRAAGGDAFELTGSALTLGDFVPAAAKLPFLSAFSFHKLTRDATTLSVAGSVAGGDAVVAEDLATKTFSVSGPALKLSNFVPAADSVPFLAKFAFGGVKQTATGVDVSGSIDGKTVVVSRANAGGSFSVTGSGLGLADFVPQAADVPVLSKFAFGALTKTPTTVTVEGTVNGKGARLVEDDASARYSVTGAGLTLADLVPAAAGVPALGAFAFDSFTHDATTLQVSGKIAGKALSVAKDLKGAGFAVTGAGLTLKDFVPEASNLPFLGAFAFTKAARTDAGLEVDGAIAGKAFSVVRDPATGSFKVTGADLKLSDFVPDAAGVPFLANFAFDGLSWSKAGLAVDGTIHGKPVSVAENPADKSFKVTGAALKLQDFVPEAAGLPFLDAFAFSGLTRSAAGVVVDGSIGGASLEVAKGPAGVRVTGSALSLANFVSAAAHVPFLSKFGFTSLDLADKTLTVSGTIDGKAVTVKKALGADAFSVTGADLTLVDFVPQASSVKFLSAFAFEELVDVPGEDKLTGKINGKSVVIDEDTVKQVFTVTGQDLTLADFIPAAAKVPFLSAFAFDKLVHSATEFDVEGKIAGKAVTVSKDLAADAFDVTGADLQLADFVPGAAKIPFLSKFAFDAFHWSASQVDVAGKIDGKKVGVDVDEAAKTFAVTGAGLKLADFVPEAASLPFLNAFAFDRLTYGASAVEVDGKLDGKAVSVSAAFGAQRAFSAKGEGLKLADIVPPTAGLKAFDALELDLVSVTAAAVEVAGKVNGKAITFTAARGSKTPDVTVTTDGLALGDIFDHLKDIPVLGTTALEKIALDGKTIEVDAMLNGKAVDVVSHVDAKNGTYVGVFFESLSAATFIPAAAGSPVDDMELDSALFLIQPKSAAPTSVSAADLPGDLAKNAGWSASEKVALNPGVNFAGHVNVARSKTLSSVLQTVGLNAANLPLRGALSASAFDPKAAKSALLAGLSLAADIPLPSLPALAGVVKPAGAAKLTLDGGGQDPAGPWGKLPAALQKARPSGDLVLSVEFGLQLPGSGIQGTLDALIGLEKSAGQESLTVIATYEGVWDKAFGVPGINLYDGGFALALEKSAAGASEELEFFAKLDLGKVKGAQVSADLLRANGKLSLQFFELDGKFDLADLPGGKNIPAHHEFELDEIKISLDGVEAKMVFFGAKVDVFLFDVGAAGTPNFTFAIDQKDFTITELLPPAKKIKPLADLKIPKVALIISENGLNLASRDQLGVIAKDMFDDIFGDAKVPVILPSGVGLLADFDVNAMGDLGKGLSKIGVHEDAIIMGAITGIFQGSPGLMLELAMETQGDAHGLPKKVINYKPNVTPAFFIQWAGLDFYAGLRIATMVQAGKDLLELATSIELEFNEEGLGIKLLGEMDGMWHKPFGIPGFNLANVKMDVGVNDTGTVSFGLAGDQQYGKCANPESADCVDLDLAMAVDFLVEAALPDGIAFKGKVSQLGIPAILHIAEEIIGVQDELSKIPMPFFEIHDALLAFATPGAEDPQLGLSGQGFAFGGKFFFMEKELGEVLGEGGPTTGIVFKGDIADIDLDILKFKNNNIDIEINLDPKFIINSEVDVFGGVSKVKLDIEPPHFEFDISEKFGVFGEADLTIRIDGFDLKTGKLDPNADFSVIGLFKEELVPWLKTHIDQGLEELKASATAKLEDGKRSLESAQRKVDGLDDQIRKIKAEDDKAKRRADASLDSAENRVRSLKGTYDHEIDEAHHCGHWYSHWACSPGWYIAAGATWLVYEAAEGALEAAKAVVAAAFDLDPRLAALYAARDVAHAALAIAEGVVEAAEAVEKWVLSELEKIINAALDHIPFEVEEAILIADLRGMIANDDPMVLDMKFSLFGEKMHEYFALKLPHKPEDLEFDVVSFALLPVLALDKILEDVLDKVSPSIGKWFHAHIAEKLAAAEAAVRAQVEAEEAKFKDVLQTFESGSAKYRSAFAEQADVRKQLTAKKNISDLMPDSLNYTDTYLAVGHSNHCLSVSADGLSVVQFHCKDDATERWSTAKLEDGYVQLKSKGQCLKARDGTSSENFEPLILAPCDAKDVHEQWKIVSTDGFYDKIVNRYSQKCLHFNDENANPQTAFAVWTSCLGVDSQQFRPLPDAEKPTWHAVNDQIEAENGRCLGVVETPGQPVKLTPQQKEHKVYSRKCGEDGERFNYIEMGVVSDAEKNNGKAPSTPPLPEAGDIKIVHADTGMCLVPATGDAHLALRACDTGKDVFWRVEGGDGKSDKIRNPYRNLCMMLPAPPTGSTADSLAVLDSCNRVPTDALELEFVK